MTRALIMFGRPGAFKGFSGKLLKIVGYEPVATGDILRKLGEMAATNPEARETYEATSKGVLVPDETTMDFFRQNLAEIPIDRSFIFDCPRSARQVDIFCDDIAPSRGISEDQIITLFINRHRDLCVANLNHRAQREKRHDDGELSIINSRLDRYESYSISTLEALRRRTKFIEIDGNGTDIEVGALVLLNLALLDKSERFLDALNKLNPQELLEQVA